MVIDPVHRVLLIAVARPPEELAAATAGPVEWPRVADVAAWHRLSEELHLRSVAARVADRIPAEVRDRLERDYLRTVARNMQLRAALERVAAALASAGIEAMLLKGMALLETAYDDLGRRPMSDIDLLVPEERLEQAFEVVRVVGHHVDERHDHERSPMRDRHHHLPALVDPDRAYAVELHRRLGPRLTVPWIWRDSSPVSPETEHLRLPAAEDLLLHVCAHFFGDRRYASYGALGQLNDVARVVASGVAWDVFADKAVRVGAHGPALVVLWCAAELFDVPVPSETLGALGSGRVQMRILERFAERRILRPEPWFSLEMVTPRKAPIRRLLPPPSRVGAERGPTAVAGAYFRRFGRAGRLVLRGLAHPAAVVADRRLNAWTRSIERDGP